MRSASRAPPALRGKAERKMEEKSRDLDAVCFAGSEAGGDDALVGNVSKLTVTPPGHTGAPRKGHLTFDACFESVEASPASCTHDLRMLRCSQRAPLHRLSLRSILVFPNSLQANQGRAGRDLVVRVVPSQVYTCNNTGKIVCHELWYVCPVSVSVRIVVMCGPVRNLGRVDYISEFEFDLFIRPDTCNPRFRVWFNFTVEHIRETQFQQAERLVAGTGKHGVRTELPPDAHVRPRRLVTTLNPLTGPRGNKESQARASAAGAEFKGHRSLLPASPELHAATGTTADVSFVLFGEEVNAALLANPSTESKTSQLSPDSGTTQMRRNVELAMVGQPSHPFIMPPDCLSLSDRKECCRPPLCAAATWNAELRPATGVVPLAPPDHLQPADLQSAGIRSARPCRAVSAAPRFCESRFRAVPHQQGSVEEWEKPSSGLRASSLLGFVRRRAGFPVALRKPSQARSSVETWDGNDWTLSSLSGMTLGNMVNVNAENAHQAEQRLPSKNVYYYRCPDHRRNYVMSFAFCFDREDDVYQFAYCYPYTYSRLQHHLASLEHRNLEYLKREQLGLSVVSGCYNLNRLKDLQALTGSVAMRLVSTKTELVSEARWKGQGQMRKSFPSPYARPDVIPVFFTESAMSRPLPRPSSIAPLTRRYAARLANALLLTDQDADCSASTTRDPSLTAGCLFHISGVVKRWPLPGSPRPALYREQWALQDTIQVLYCTRRLLYQQQGYHLADIEGHNEPEMEQRKESGRQREGAAQTPPGRGAPEGHGGHWKSFRQLFNYPCARSLHRCRGDAPPPRQQAEPHCDAR
ncbi:hypothetical protein P4O66_022889 [Electrophorus voltai]|uniref:Cytosolic carboxypeptidase N-terminal domain-containing protein n=1 Tax=Electrophorus voltai TaxID=2609070 RepID=A0AAD8ZPJ9_9TELE|nr:hypothetical protein P4O66_022889 [Electrophorus voltai]